MTTHVPERKKTKKDEKIRGGKKEKEEAGRLSLSLYFPVSVFLSLHHCAIN